MTQTTIIPAEYATLIASDRLSARTRAALLDRAQPDDPAYTPVALKSAELGTLRALTNRILPQSGQAIDLAQRIDAMLAEGGGDGWRFADLPPDREAYQIGLAALDAWAQSTHGTVFGALNPTAKDAMLTDLAGGRAPSGGQMNPVQLVRWFEDVRADATRLYVSHPATMARMGYSGIGYGGDTERLPGFHELGPDAREAWEPSSHAPWEPRA